MKQLKMIIERSKDLYGIYAENESGMIGTGSGETIEEAKQSLLKSIEIIKEYNKPENIPDILKGDYEIVYKFDVQSFLEYYRGIFTPAALERIAGINQRLIHHYSTGLKKPRPAQRKKIETALHKLGLELLAIEL